MFIKFKNVNYIYDVNSGCPIRALKNIDLEVNPGEFICITGPTGSGKTTLIQHINGLLKPTTGRLFLDNAEISYTHEALQKIRSQIGLLFQFPEDQLFEETVYKDIAFAPSKLPFYTMGDIPAKVAQAMAMVRLPYEQFKDVAPMKLSGGQKRRAALAGVLVMEPKVLILDEPTVGLDPLGKEEIMDVICRINKSGTTVIMITHEVELIAEHAGRIVAMDNGKIVLDGTPNKILNRINLLRELNLDIPEPAYIAEQLSINGWKLPNNIVRWRDLEYSIINLWNKRREL